MALSSRAWYCPKNTELPAKAVTVWSFSFGAAFLFFYKDFRSVSVLSFGLCSIHSRLSPVHLYLCAVLHFVTIFAHLIPQAKTNVEFFQLLIFEIEPALSYTSFGENRGVVLQPCQLNYFKDG